MRRRLRLSLVFQPSLHSPLSRLETLHDHPAVRPHSFVTITIQFALVLSEGEVGKRSANHRIQLIQNREKQLRSFPRRLDLV